MESIMDKIHIKVSNRKELSETSNEMKWIMKWIYEML